MNRFVWYLFTIISVFLLWYVTLVIKVDPAGDIPEYYGMTETLIEHAGFNLTKQAEETLSQVLHPEYFTNPGYYVEGRNGNRYPVHFVAYSVLSLPARAVLALFQMDQRLALSVTNVLMLIGTIGYLFYRFVKDPFKRLALLTLVLLSPFLSFLSWPGPDIYYISLLLVSAFYFFDKRYLTASMLVALASWHSQPLLILSLLMLGYYFITSVMFDHKDPKKLVTFPIMNVVYGAGVVGLLAIPYLLNLYFFGVLSPWTILKDGWTIMNGFGIHNASLGKLFEMFFDLDMGLFWYTPLIFISSIALFIKEGVKKNYAALFLLGSLIVTAIFYQTNPAWHYGTAGYGPTRHILFVLPFLIYAIVNFMNTRIYSYVLLGFIAITQLYPLSFNGFLQPQFPHVLFHTPYAEYVLNNFPSWYNPTPEIFVDRTNHTDLPYPTSAFYKVDGKCKKAWVVITEKDRLIKECGSIPEKYVGQFDNEFRRKSKEPREVTTFIATFWPDPVSCVKEYFPSEKNPFICMRTLADAVKLTGITEADRFAKLKGYENYEGIWTLKLGSTLKFTVPPGYIIDHYSFDGVYVTY